MKRFYHIVQTLGLSLRPPDKRAFLLKYYKQF